MQAVFHHVLPLAAPGILTGTIIGLAQALGETAPLLADRDGGLYGASVTRLTGLVAGFTVSPTRPCRRRFTTWSKRADVGLLRERAWGGIIILLIFLADNEHHRGYPTPPL